MFFNPLLVAAIFSGFISPIAWAKNNFKGLTVSNSIGGTSPYRCRTQQEWNTLVNDAKNAGFTTIRLVEMNCGAVQMAASAASAAGLKVMAGSLIQGSVASSEAQINGDVQTFIAAYKQFGPNVFSALNIGNEVSDSPAALMAKVNEVRGTLRAAGVTTPVGTVAIWVTLRDNPQLLGTGDYCAANAHAFYDGNFKSSQAGDFLSNIVLPGLRAACPGKTIYITETGWPSRGPNFGVAVPSLADEYDALVTLNRAASNNSDISFFAFEYDDQLWKGNDNERSFGIFGKFDLVNDLFAKC